MSSCDPYYLQWENVYLVPVLHYNLETALLTRQLFCKLQPDCVAVELPETMEEQLLQAARRLPDIAVVFAYSQERVPLYYLATPGDSSFEALRSALEAGVAAYCIDLDVDYYPLHEGPLPDPYALSRIGHKAYFEAYERCRRLTCIEDRDREEQMAHRLKELSLRHERVLFVGGMSHVVAIANKLPSQAFELLRPVVRETIQVATVTEDSCRELLPDAGYFLTHYEQARDRQLPLEAIDRQQLLLSLYKEAAERYERRGFGLFRPHSLTTLMKFARNYALVTENLTPDLFQLLTAARGCVDQHFAYEVWKLATYYPFLHNIDGLPEVYLTAKELWGDSKTMRFKFLDKSQKGSFWQRLPKDRKDWYFAPGATQGFCSYQPEDLIIEQFSATLRQRGARQQLESMSRSIPFSCRLEEGIDTKETLRHFGEGQLYVKAAIPCSKVQVGSVVVIFDEELDASDERGGFGHRYPWCATWHGEHHQESDMAFYATAINETMVGPGISRCLYGGFMMSYPPRRLFDVWSDPDYAPCRSKAELLLMAAIDYSVDGYVVYSAPRPPASRLKSYAGRFGKKVIYLPLGQLSPVALGRLRRFHVLDGHPRRQIADDYIF